MNIVVFRNNNKVSEINFANEVKGNQDMTLSFFLGRDPECHIFLDNKKISRNHAEIIYDKGSWKIKSISLVRKIILNGNPTDEAVLNNGDIISVDGYILSVSMPKEEDVDPINQELSENENEVDGTEDNIEELQEKSWGDEQQVQQEPEDVEFQHEEFSNNTQQEQPVLEEDVQDEFLEENTFEEDSLAGDDSGDSTKVISSLAVFNLSLAGEYAPYDKFSLDSNKTYIGRDPKKCQIILNDPEVSSVHAVIHKSNIVCELEDLNSSNGTLLNGERINKSRLNSGDEFIIGSTTFSVELVSEFLKEEEDRLMPVEHGQEIEVEEVVEVSDFSEPLEGEADDLSTLDDDKKPVSLFSKDSFKDPKKRKKIIYILCGILVLFLLFSEEDTTKPTVKKNNKEENSNLLVKKKKEKQLINRKTKRALTEAEKELIDSTYQLSKELYERGKYAESIFELEKIFQITDDYKNSRQLYELSKEGLKELELIAKKEREEKEKREREVKVKNLVVKAKKATKERKVKLAEAIFASILKLDPENFDVANMKVEIDVYKKEQERLAVEKAQKEAERKRQIKALSPGKTFFLKKEWYKAINSLEVFLKQEGIDEDLIKEATDMFTKAQANLKKITGPLLGKARSLREGQDLKGAYEYYKEVLSYDPPNVEALNEMSDILESLEIKSKKLYREAIISESLNLFEDAKEKFQEVQQISPIDSVYYKKATDKLKDYLD